MKSIYNLLLIVVLAVVATSCDRVSFKKTKTGLIYKIIPSNSKDSTAKVGDWLKIHFTQFRNGDSIIRTSYGRMPAYLQVVNNPDIRYDPSEIFPLLKKGDSAVVIMLADSIFNKRLNREMPPIYKKGDRLELRLKVVDVFRDDQKYQADAQIEQEKDAPRAMEEQKKMMAERKHQIDSMINQEMVEVEKSGEAPKQRKEIEDYLAAKKITVQKTPEGTYVHIDQPGTGPQASSGKYLAVKYAGRVLVNDSTFDSGTYPFQLGTHSAIEGWDDGLVLFKQGGKGTLYIPAYRAYGKRGREGTVIKPGSALIFDVEILSVSDTMPAQQTGP
jgi:FKBP-type peptidyl-prolyl cis-trans isomerase